ncbi:hypothetical protein ACLB2K_041859 [Fragaria x ananassa]
MLIGRVSNDGVVLEDGEGEVVVVAEGIVGLVVLAVDEEVEVELTCAEVCDGGAAAGVDVEAEAVMGEVLVGEAEARPEGPPFAGDEGGLDNVEGREEGQDVEEDFVGDVV